MGKTLSKFDKELLDAALLVRKNAYAPYSTYKVGAAVRTKSGVIYSGCNIESADYTLSTHAEMCAIDKAVSEGEKEFVAIAIVTSGKIASPCGLCRQKMSEFCKNIRIICGNTKGDVTVTDLDSLLPHRFSAAFFRKQD